MRLPVDHKARDPEAFVGGGLPTRVRRGWADEVNPIAGRTGQQMLPADVAGIEQVLAGEQLARGEIRFDHVGHLHIVRARRHGRDMADQMGRVHVAGFGEVNRVPGPGGLALGVEARVRIIGGLEQEGPRGQVLLCAQAHHPRGRVGRVVVVEPHAPQDLHRGDLAQPAGRRRAVDRGEQLHAIGPDPRRQRVALRLRLRQARVRDPDTVAVVPVGGDLRSQPVGDHHGERIEGVAERLADTFQAIERAHRRQDVGRVGALLAPYLE